MITTQRIALLFGAAVCIFVTPAFAQDRDSLAQSSDIAAGIWFTNGTRESRDCGDYSFIGLGGHLRFSLAGTPSDAGLMARVSAYMDREATASYDGALGLAFAERLHVLAGYSRIAVQFCGRDGGEEGATSAGGFMFGIAYGITGLYAEMNLAWYSVDVPFTEEQGVTTRDAGAISFRLGYAFEL